MTQKQIYTENLAANMRSAGQHNWTYSDMADICDLADLWEWWLSTVTRNEEETIALRAAKILGVEIRHIVKGVI